MLVSHFKIKTKVIYFKSSFNYLIMTKSQICYSFFYNFLSFEKDKFINKTFIKSNDTYIINSITSYIFLSVFPFILVSTSGLTKNIYTNTNLQKTIKLAFKSFI